MSKRAEKISKIEKQMEQLANQRKKEIQKHKQEERKATNNRLIRRGGVMEKALPDLMKISDDQFDIFVRKALATNHSKNLLAELAAQNGTASTPEKTEQSKSKTQLKEQANSQTVSTANQDV